MADIVNLRRARKAKVRADKDAAAAQARVLHGRAKADKALDTANSTLTRKRLDAHKKDPKE